MDPEKIKFLVEDNLEKSDLEYTWREISVSKPVNHKMFLTMKFIGWF